MLCSDNDTHWGITYEMIRSATKAKDCVKMLMNSVDELANDRLTEEEQGQLEEILQLLEPFQVFTKRLQGKNTSHGSLLSVLPAMDCLLSHLEKAKEKSRPRDTPFQCAIEKSWSTLDKYYTLTDSALVNIAAVVLDPRMKMDYFQRNWKEEWLTAAKAKVESF